jgi:hypothetical protein
MTDERWKMKERSLKISNIKELVPTLLPPKKKPQGTLI